MNVIQNTVVSLALLLASAAASADGGISRWTDSAGNTHFADTQLAPAGAQSVSLQQVNGMDVPSQPSGNGSQANGPTWSLIERPPKKNRKGWRAKGESLRSGRSGSRHRR